MEYVERKRWLFLGLPFTFTKYTVKEDMITVDEGLLKTGASSDSFNMNSFTSFECLICCRTSWGWVVSPV